MRYQEASLHGVKLAAKLKVLETQKTNAEEDVQNADVLQIPDPDYDEANTHKGIYMDGSLYLEGENPDEAEALNEENQAQMGEKYDLEEARLQAEEQKVAGDFTGVGSFLKARDEERMGGSGEADSMTKAAIQGGTQLASPVASAMGILSGVGGMGATASAFGIGKGIA